MVLSCLCCCHSSFSITSQNLGSQDVLWIVNSALNKDKSAIPPLFNSPEVLSSASDKAKFFAENLSKNSYLDESGIFLPVFSCRFNVKLHISVTPKMVKKVIMNLDFLKASCPDCIPVVVLKNCEPELLTCKLNFSISVRTSLVFLIVGRFHQWSHYLRMFVGGKAYC